MSIFIRLNIRPVYLMQSLFDGIDTGSFIVPNQELLSLPNRVGGVGSVGAWVHGWRVGP